MKGKAIFGGTFDPIHNGHLHIAYEALEKLKLDEVIFMPSGNPPHKLENRKTDADIRYRMVEMAIGGENKFSTSDYEIVEQGISYTYKTLEHFKTLEPHTKWYFIAGVDCLMELDSWREVNRILEAATLTIFTRPGYMEETVLKKKMEVEGKYHVEILLLEVPLMDISSSNIRQRIASGKPVYHLMPPSIEDFIISKGLYKI